jgi:uncharacterized protein
LTPKIKIRELESINLEGGYLVDGFPSAGFSSAIASESLMEMAQILNQVHNFVLQFLN